MIKFTTKISKEDISFKAGAFADDIGVLCGGDLLSIKKVFQQYGKLTRRSGLVLNADKTEISVFSNDRSRPYVVDYDSRQVNLVTLNEIKICGIWFCNDRARAYQLNIQDKILKMESNLRAGRNRNLTYEGKSLIIKTFGLSQLIYGMQVIEIKDACIKKIEQIMFGYIDRVRLNHQT